MRSLEREVLRAFAGMHWTQPGGHRSASDCVSRASAWDKEVGHVATCSSRGNATRVCLFYGFFGDGLMYAFGISRDMLRAGLLRELHRYVLAGKGMRARVRLFGRSMTGLLPPALALRALTRIDNRSWEAAPPRWMGPELLARYPPPPEVFDLPDVDWPSHLACELWAHMTGPRTAAVVDATVVYGAEDGVEIRMPYLDVRLVQKLLDVSWQARLPRRDEHRRLNRDVFGPLLPAEFAKRVDQGSWMPVWALGARRMLPAIERIFSTVNGSVRRTLTLAKPEPCSRRRWRVGTLSSQGSYFW